MEFSQLIRTPGLGRAYAFADVVADYREDGETTFHEHRLDGILWSEFRSGPNLWELANAVAEEVENGRRMSVGLKSCMFLGYWSDREDIKAIFQARMQELGIK